jgi:hypothetical protein
MTARLLTLTAALLVASPEELPTTNRQLPNQLRIATYPWALGIGSWELKLAHHAIGSIYDSSNPVKVEGVVVDFQFVNPHPFIVIETATEPSAREQWRLDMDNRYELVQVGMSASTFRKGDRVIATGGPARDKSRSLYVRRLDRPDDGFWYEQAGSSPRVGRK